MQLRIASEGRRDRGDHRGSSVLERDRRCSQPPDAGRSCCHNQSRPQLAQPLALKLGDVVHGATAASLRPSCPPHGVPQQPRRQSRTRGYTARTALPADRPLLCASATSPPSQTIASLTVTVGCSSSSVLLPSQLPQPTRFFFAGAPPHRLPSSTSSAAASTSP